jgi:hypothetical protein
LVEGRECAKVSSIGGGEPLADVLGLFDLVEDGDGEVLARLLETLD